MASWLFSAPTLPEASRRTYRFHLLYAVFDAVAGGLIATAPVIALKEMSAPVWQLGLSLTLSGAGMLSTLYLSNWMASRPKMPFVFLPGVASAVATSLMAFTNNSLLFLFLGGVGLMFSTITRPAVAAIIRLNYPASHRGQATGEIRAWSSLVFVLAFLASSAVLDFASTYSESLGMTVVRGLILLAGAMCLISFLLFHGIRVEEDPSDLAADYRPHVLQSFREAFAVVAQDSLYRRYVLVCLLYNFAAMTYVSYIPAFLEKDLHYTYVQCALLLHIVPAVVSFLTTGWLGRWFDRTRLSTAWAWVAFGWGLDPLLLAATAACAAFFGPAALIIPVLARISRGTVQGGLWILWWQIGVAQFARTGGEASRYQGILVFVDGITRMTAPAVGAWVLAASGSSREALFVVGGLGVMLSGVLFLFDGRYPGVGARLTPPDAPDTQFRDGAP